MDSPFSSSSPLSTGSYRPPRPKVTAASFLALLPALGAAVVVGIIYHFIGRFLDLLIIFPLVVGVIVGGVIVSLAVKNKVRSKFALGLVGILAGALCFGTREFCDSLYVREMAIPAIAHKYAGSNAALESKLEGQLRSSMTPIRFFPIYLQDAAEQGITISSTHDYSSSSSNKPVTGVGFWLLFAADALIITGTAALAAIGQAKKPFCEPCDNWYGPELTVTRLHPNQAEDAKKLIQSNDFAGLGNLRGEGAGEKLHSDVLVSKCSGCGNGHLKLTTTRGNNVKTVIEGDYPPDDIKKLEEVRAQWLK